MCDLLLNELLNKVGVFNISGFVLALLYTLPSIWASEPNHTQYKHTSFRYPNGLHSEQLIDICILF